MPSPLQNRLAELESRLRNPPAANNCVAATLPRCPACKKVGRPDANVFAYRSEKTRDESGNVESVKRWMRCRTCNGTFVAIFD